MRATELLKEEHTAIKLMLNILDAVCQKLDARKEVNQEHLAQILTFIKTFADQCHHGKEETVLFPETEAAGIPREGGPIGVMLTEHDTGRDYVRGMSEAVSRYQAGERNATPDFVKNARGYIDLLTQHIDKEDNILYPMADTFLTPEKQEALPSEFERIENERIGASKHEELHQLLHQLAGIYLA